MKKNKVIEFLGDWAIIAVFWLAFSVLIAFGVFTIVVIVIAISDAFGLWSLLGLVPIIGALIQVIWYWITEE